MSIASGAVAVCAFAGLDGSHVLPVEHEAILYSKGQLDDVVSRLQKKVASGEVALEYDSTFGYLPSVLLNPHFIAWRDEF
ncbi:MAG: hypothetical protein H0U64_00835 [Gemmatimonadaceae bacterium]|nr:hypothetical protein [Gemmatimonadaceae bacterium]